MNTMSQLVKTLLDTNKSFKNIIGACRSGGFYSTKPSLSEDDVEEVKIPVPWGHIAGKWWGNKDGLPILGIHGWQDNASSFDRLIPLLNISNFMAIDLPGHGLSSHLPIGKLYTFPEYLYTMRRVIKYLQWKRYSIIGHSFGSVLGFVHSSIYNEEIDCFINLECARALLLTYAVNMPQHLEQGIDKLLKYEKKIGKDPASHYALPDIIESFKAGSLGSVSSAESTFVLMKRDVTKQEASDASIKKIGKSSDLKELLINEDLKNVNISCSEKIMTDVGDSIDVKDSGYLYQFNKDPRINVKHFGIFNEDMIIEFAKHITCPVLSIEGKDGFLNCGRTVYDKSNELIRENSKHFEHHVVDGNHHAHLNTPESVSPIINKFLRKYWGSREERPFLLLHGWQDNASSFDKLIPFLPKDRGYLAIDFPGHGFSSHYPKGAFYSSQDSISNIRRIQNYFSWRKFSLIGHSLGGIVGFMYSAIFNNEVEAYVALDAVKPISISPGNCYSKARERIEKFLDYDSRDSKDVRRYEENEIIGKMKKALNTENEEICKIIMRRGMTESNGLFAPVRDPRIKSLPPFGFAHNDNIQFANRIKCNVLVIKSQETTYYEPKERFYDILEIIKKNAKYFEYVKISGIHHFHLEKPECVASILENFFNRIE